MFSNMNSKLLGIALAFGAALMICSCSGKDDFSRKEKKLLKQCDSTMRVLTIDNPEDSLILRRKCSRIPVKALDSKEYNKLAELMIATVTSPEQDGVGIAGPQVGISRRIVAVQRFDKEGEPFEVYPNISIISVNGDMEEGPEGCLSVPGRKGVVPRYQEISIRYSKGQKDTMEHVQGYTAVIFQHECDHLDGIVYTDKATSVTNL